MNNPVKLILGNILVASLLLALFDVFMFFVLPERYATAFPDYRTAPPPSTAGHGRYPKGYFVAHDQRGFDIEKNTSGDHWVSGVSYPIWSNSSGCFDREHANTGDYVYFAGDSGTWGYAPFEKKFGTILEKATGTPIFKCGVPHTGQLHQFDKFSELASRSRKMPRAVFVFHTSNDVANDYAYPHSTVIQGWLVDTVSLDGKNGLVRHSHVELIRKTRDKLEELQRLRAREQQSPAWWRQFKGDVRYYSLTANILLHIRHLAAKPPSTQAGHGEDSASGGKDSALRQFYYLPQSRKGRYWYSDNPASEKNKLALLQFKKFSVEHDIDLVIILIPSPDNPVDTGWFQEMREFLRENGIRYLDLSEKYRDRKLARTDLAWTHDGHPSPSGNAIIADILMDEFPAIFGHRSTPAGTESGSAAISR